MKNSKGFTLIELIVAIAIVAILSVILIPTVTNAINSANEAVDVANVRTLNYATQLYYVSESIEWDQLLSPFSNDLQRQQHLIDQGYLQVTVNAKSDQYEIKWNDTIKQWYYTKFELALVNTTTLNFSTISDLSMFKKGADGTGTANNWQLSNQGLIGNVGSIFFDNPNDAYVIETTGRLNSVTSSGGFGIYVESTLSQDGNVMRDSGYIVQFDRGLGNGEIVVRKRTNSAEAGPIIRSTIGVENKNSNPDWWTQNQDIKVEVMQHPSDTSKKIMNVYVNGVKSINDLVIDSNPQSSQNFTGVRGWSQSSTIESMTITPQP